MLQAEKKIFDAFAHFFEIFIFLISASIIYSIVENVLEPSDFIIRVQDKRLF
jgi:hypothetical protein